MCPRPFSSPQRARARSGLDASTGRARPTAAPRHCATRRTHHAFSRVDDVKTTCFPRRADDGHDFCASQMNARGEAREKTLETIQGTLLVVRLRAPSFASRAKVPPVEALEPRELEHRVVRLLLDLRAPVPRRGEPPVDARPGVEEVVRARPVERVPEEIRKDASPATLDRLERRLDVRAQIRVVAQRLDGIDNQHDGP